MNAETSNAAEVVLNYSPSDDNRVAAFNMAENLKTIFRFHTPAGDNSDIWVYDASIGIWVPYGKDLIEEIVTRSMAQHYNSRILNEVIRQMRNLTRDRTVKLGENAPTKMVMKNGVIDVETGVFSSAFRPDDYHITALSYEYNPDADCPKFKKFLEEICPIEDDRLALEEFMGYCLVKHHDIPVFILLTGSGDNGKSTFLNVLIWMLGEENTTAMSLYEISRDKFMKARLRGKLANICPDISSAPIKHTGVIKILTGKDKTSAQHKHQDPFDFRNYAKLIFSGNQIPEFNDKTDAWYKRIRPIVFPNKFTKTDEKTVVGLEKILVEKELPGILNFAIQGWQRMRSQKHLTGEKPIEEKEMEILKRSNPISYFILRYCRPNGSSVIPVSIVYDCYNALFHYLKKQGYFEAKEDPMTRRYFGTRFNDLVDYISERQPKKIEGKTIWYYSGLEIDLDLMEKEIGYDTSIFFRNVQEYIIKFHVIVTQGPDDPNQTRLTPNGDPARPQPPLPDKSLFKIWSSRDLDYGISIDFDTLSESERKMIGGAVESGFEENDPKGKWGASTYSLTARGLNACESDSEG